MSSHDSWKGLHYPAASKDFKFDIVPTQIQLTAISGRRRAKQKLRRAKLILCTILLLSTIDRRRRLKECSCTGLWECGRFWKWELWWVLGGDTFEIWKLWGRHFFQIQVLVSKPLPKAHGKSSNIVRSPVQIATSPLTFGSQTIDMLIGSGQ